MRKEHIEVAYQQIQDEICSLMEQADGGATFSEDLWTRDGGGGGRTRIIQHGRVIEKGGVNFSAVFGELPDAVKRSFGVDTGDFFATGVSIVMHPVHPLVPIIHMNIRYFEMGQQHVWFGGGIDLTPHYVSEEDARFFHQSLKKVCDGYDPAFYPDFKRWADDYFYLPHRKETRGVGGIFFDRLTPEKTGLGLEQLFSFTQALGRCFGPLYAGLIDRNRHKSWTKEQKEWQHLRRSRYAEFNLVYDAGTRFGLETNGRIESILMSMPPQANWYYNYSPAPGSEEEKTLHWLRKGVEWA